jgi:hypothetical protein
MPTSRCTDTWIRELIDGQRCYTLLRNWSSIVENEEDAAAQRNLYRQLSTYAERALPTTEGDHSSELLVCVPYTKSDMCRATDTPGRVYAHGSLSLQNMPKRIRHTLASGVLLDFDLKNAHPTLVLQYATESNLAHSAVEEYVTDRERVLAELSLAMGVPRSEAKKVMLQLLFGLELDKLRFERAIPPHLVRYAAEVVTVHQHMMSNRDHTRLLSAIRQQKDFREALTFTRKHREPQPDNVEGALCSHILMALEARAMTAAAGVLYERLGIEHNAMVPMHDGFMVPCLPFQQMAESEKRSLLRAMSSRAQTATRSPHLAFEEKPFDKAYDLSTMPQVPCPPKFSVEYDIDAAKALLQILRDSIRKGKVIYMRTREGTWTANTRRHESILSYECMMSHIMRKPCHDKDQVRKYAADMAPARSVVTAALHTIAGDWCDDGFDRQLHEGSLNKIFFKNGVWDFLRREFRADDVASDFSTIRIPWDFSDGAPRDMDAEEAVWDIMDGIFSDREDSRCFLAHLARALAGSYTDKQWLIVHGARNSGKGVLQEMIRASCGPYVGTINANELMMDSGPNGSDQAKRLSWLQDVTPCRIVITSEVTMDLANPKSKLDGNKIKGTFSSGGDPRQVRQNYANEVTVVPEGRLIMMCNDLPPVTPNDVLRTHHLFRTDFQYVRANEISEGEDEGEDEAPSGSSENTRVGDNDIKARCRQPDIARAFMRMMLDAYKDSEVVPSSNVAKLTKQFRLDSLEEGDVLKRMLKFTGERKDALTMADVEQVVRTAKLNINKLGIRGVLQGMGAKQTNAAAEVGGLRRWHFSGVKFRDGDEAEGENVL